ncbi:hypothetical protein [Salinisphaera sp. T31B1]|uniref:hypothetical protein n=1 Tax=Salinisphaera sp. T31B1 TaxID=727963 RepID=UPI0033408451
MSAYPIDKPVILRMLKVTHSGISKSFIGSNRVDTVYNPAPAADSFSAIPANALTLKAKEKKPTIAVDNFVESLRLTALMARNLSHLDKPAIL